MSLSFFFLYFFVFTLLFSYFTFNIWNFCQEFNMEIVYAEFCHHLIAR